MSLNLLLDSGDPDVCREWLKTGIFRGITTNPTLLMKAGQTCTIENLKKLVQIAKEIKCKELHLQAWGRSSYEITNCGLRIGELSTSELKIHVKIPITKDGCEAAKELINANISVTLTGCYEVKQVIIASAIGATYIAPYLGRINDKGIDGIDYLISMKKILQNTKSNCKLLVASVRATQEINNLASNGIETYTINSTIAKELFESKSTQEASERFERDARVKKSLISPN